MGRWWRRCRDQHELTRELGSKSARTHGWDTQLDAQVLWGKDDTCLCHNDTNIQTWKPYGVGLDPFSGREKKLEYAIYRVSPDGRFAASPCLLRTGRTQAGYGVIAPGEAVPRNEGAPQDDGVYVTCSRIWPPTPGGGPLESRAH